MFALQYISSQVQYMPWDRYHNNGQVVLLGLCSSKGDNSYHYILLYHPVKKLTSMVLCQCTADHVTEAWGITLTDFIYLIWKHIIPLSSLRLLVGLSCLTPLSTIFQLYREGNGSTWRKPPTCRKSLTNFIK
jgi:hypothetical protein